jgi:hypothetical protein
VDSISKGLMIVPDAGVLLVAATSLLWPAGAGVALALRREASRPAWRVFLGAGLAAVVVAALLFAWAYVLFAFNGTARAMASLGPQIAALTCLGGAAVCALTAAVLRLREGGREPS